MNARAIRLALLSATLMLFAQLAMAAEACDVATADEDCAVHCLAQDRLASTLDQPLTVLPVLPLLAPTSAAPRGKRVPSLSLHDERLPAGPPLRVLFCSYRT